MIQEERKHIILQELSRTSVVKLEDLSQQLNVSIDTVRRDLKALDRAGLVQYIRGGAKAVHRLVACRGIQADGRRRHVAAVVTEVDGSRCQVMGTVGCRDIQAYIARNLHRGRSRLSSLLWVASRITARHTGHGQTCQQQQGLIKLYHTLFSGLSLISRILRQVLVTVERCLRNGQQVRVLVIGVNQRETAFILQVVHDLLHFAPTAQVEPTLAFHR